MGRMIRVPLSSEDTLALEKFLGKKCDDATRSETKTELNAATGIAATVLGSAAVSYGMDVDFSTIPVPEDARRTNVLNESWCRNYSFVTT